MALLPHPQAPGEAVRRIETRVTQGSNGMLNLRYDVEGDLSQVRMPPAAPPRRADELWRHTCFEVFIAPAPGPGYVELNFSPSGDWASYRFAAYRKGRTNDEHTAAPAVTLTHSERRMTVDVSVRLPLLCDAAPASLALAAVIEEATGRLAYWALRHPPGPPDFHHPDGFLLQI